MNLKRKRTLGKRISRTTRWCILLAVAVFCAVISYRSIYLTKQNSSFFAGMFANVLANKLSSESYLDSIHIDSLEQVEPDSKEAALMGETITHFENNQFRYLLVNQGDVVSIPPEKQLNEIERFEGRIHQINVIDKGITKFNDVCRVRLVINGKTIYQSVLWDKLPPGLSTLDPENSSLISKIYRRFITEATYIIPDANGKPMAEVHVRIEPTFTILFYGMLILGILCAALASLLAAMILTNFFTKSVARPFVVLDKNLKYLAEGNYQELLNSHIQVKRPLAEIRSIADSTNLILDKMHAFNNIISAQNELLEKQNFELEAQNEEIHESRLKIQEAQAQMIQNQNLASVGQLTAAISHEINTPLGTINSNVQLQNMILDMLLANPEVSSDADLQGTLKELREAGSHSAASCDQVALIIRSLKNFSRLDQADFQEADINENAKSVVLLTRFLWRNKINMHQNYGQLPMIKCYPGLLNQVFMNLLVSSIRSIPQEGDISINTWADDDYVYTSIRDNGKAHVKTPVKIKTSSALKADYDLDIDLEFSICKNIIDKHHGVIELKSLGTVGNEYLFILPIHVPTT